MWILPKPLLTSLCVPDTEVLTLDSPELLEMFARSLMWRSKPSPSRTWSRRWNRENWLQLLSGRILRPSTGASFVEKWISSQEGSLVSRFPLLEVEKETMTLGTYGHISPEASGTSDLPLFSWRMLTASSPQNLKETDGTTRPEHRWLSMSSEHWKGWVIEQRQDHSARSKSVRLISGKEFSSSRRETTLNLPLLLLGKLSSGGQLEEEQLKTLGSLPAQSHSNWRTPLAEDVDNRAIFTRSGAPWRGEGAAYSASGRFLNQISLTDQIRHMNLDSLFGIPRAAMAKAPLGGGHGKDAKYRIENQTHPQRGYLNPRWVEALMGLPIGWVDPFKSGPVSLTSRTDELRLLGNGVVPATAERAIRVLLPRLFKTKGPRRIARASAPTS